MKQLPIESYVVPTLEERKRLSDFLAGSFQTIPSRKAFKTTIKKGLVKLNGIRAYTADFVSSGDLIEIFQDTSANNKPSIELEVAVLFEDEYLAVVHKPAGIVVSGNKKFTLENSLSFNLEKSSQVDALIRPEPIHRLDYPTSGCLLIGKTSEALLALNAMFESKTIQKTYHAITVGPISEAGEINIPIESKASETHYKRLAQLPSEKYGYLNLLELNPRTGRKHQLRRHLSSIGTPIFGDKIYGNIGRGSGLYLHATSLQFTHPITSEAIHIKTKLPKKFINLFPKYKI
ncbi:MAG: 23S rRNA pseudouridine1911/1915/1917 synthase [Candidatus Latescibacterota bacterium]